MINSMEIFPALQSLREALVAVGEELLRRRDAPSLVEVRYKREGQEIVSNIDREVEEVIRREVKTCFPNHLLWGEELGRDSGDLATQNFIIIDPIDGSANYLAGSPLFGTQVACVENGALQWSIVVLPALDACYLAIKNQGAERDGKPITASTQSELSKAIHCFGLGHDASVMTRHLKRLGGVPNELRQYGSAAVHLSFLASGAIDIYMAEEAALYDLAPGLLLCQEVGGLEFANLDGTPYIFGEHSTGIVIANPALLAAFRSLVSPAH